MSANQLYEQLAEMVDEAMLNLRARMEDYESKTLTTKTGKPRTGVSALAEELNVSRTNLIKIFSDSNTQQMSTWLFIKLCQKLGVWPRGLEYTPTKELETQNVKTAITTPRDALMVCVSILHAS